MAGTRRTWGGPQNDGLRRPINAPPPGSLAPGVQPGVSTSVVVANKVIVIGPGDGVFVYAAGTTPGLGNPPITWSASGLVDPFGNTLPSTTGVAGTGTFAAGSTRITPAGTFTYSGTPALGNLIWANVTTTGTDPFGNVVYRGSFSYSSSGGATPLFGSGLQNGNLLFGTGAALSGTGGRQPSSVASGGDGIASTDSGLANGTDSSASLTYRSAANALHGTTPEIISTATLYSLTQWTAITLDAGWTAGPQVPQYRLLPDGNVQVRGQCTHASVTAVTAINSGAPILGTYRPALTRYYRASDPNDTAGLVMIDTAGVFSVRASAGFPATQALMDGIYSVA